MSEQRKEEEVENKEQFNNKNEENEKDKNSSKQKENEDINFESINFNINPFKIENVEIQQNIPKKTDDSIFNEKDNEYYNIKYNNIRIEKINEILNINPIKVSQNIQQKKIGPYFDYNTIKNIELNNKTLNMNNKGNRNYPTFIPSIKYNENNNKSSLISNQKNLKNLKYYNFNNNIYTNVSSSINPYKQIPNYNQRIIYNPYTINNNNQIKYISNNANNNNISTNYNNNNNNIIRQQYSWVCPFCNNFNIDGKYKL